MKWKIYSVIWSSSHSLHISRILLILLLMHLTIPYSPCNSLKDILHSQTNFWHWRITVFFQPQTEMFLKWQKNFINLVIFRQNFWKNKLMNSVATSFNTAVRQMTEMSQQKKWLKYLKYGKRSLKHLGPKIWHKIDPSLHDSSQLTFKKQYRDVLISAYDDR